MIAGIFHRGSGVGNQLFRYVATRVLALDKGYTFGMVAPELCKVKDFMNLDMGKEWLWPHRIEMPSGKVIPEVPEYLAVEEGKIDDYPLWEEKTNYYNPEFNFTKDNTVIDGEFQDERYFEHRLSDINEWFSVPTIPTHNLCVIGFRGGEFSIFPELFLPKEYWDEAIAEMKRIAPNVRFEVHTDDLILAKQFFPDYPIIHNVGINWRTVRYAPLAIIANSSFYILPRLLRHFTEPTESITIAPRYWARRNTKEWSMPQNYYKSFQYI